jgi:hypothetical protein
VSGCGEGEAIERLGFLRMPSLFFLGSLGGTYCRESLCVLGMVLEVADGGENIDGGLLFFTFENVKDSSSSLSDPPLAVPGPSEDWIL